jgi:predicted amidohydrolase YtcJ
LREAHAHIAAYGQSLATPSLAQCTSVAGCLDTLHRLAASMPAPGWLRAHSARIESWTPPRWPTLAELDTTTGDTPCVVMSFDHHAAIANSAALAAASLRAGQAVPPAGVVCTDPHTGHPNGLLLEHAAYRAWESAPEPSMSEWIEHLHTALKALASLGFTTVHDLHSQDWLGSALASLERQGRLPMREILLYPPVARLAALHADRDRWQSPRLRLAGGKLFADGTLNSRTALMLAPYREPLPDHPRGRAMSTPRELDDAIRLTESLGLHLAVHAIGDGAVRTVLDAFERTATPRPSAGRHRLEHAELIDEADIPRFAALGIVCSVQPCHLLTDIEVLTRQLPHRLHRVLPLRDLIQSGCTPRGEDSLLWFGSDVPIVRPDPADSLHAAIHRRRADMPESAAIAWNQRLTESEARAALS